MTPMNFLICHSSAIAAENLTSAFEKSFPNATVLKTDNLTSAYHVAEHQQPHYLLVEERLAGTQDFSLMKSLVEILKIQCWVIGEGAAQLLPSSLKDMPFITTEASQTEIIEAFCGRKTQPATNDARMPTAVTRVAYRRDSLILIGASTGGVDALAKILTHFSGNTPPALIVQHTGGSFTKSLIRLLNSATEARVRPAVAGEAVLHGHIYLAPDDETHLCLEGKTTPRISLRSEGLLSGHRPSIDALFRSAKPFAPRIAAALLTGMGQDGARGLLMLRQAGARTFGQNAATSIVYGMPRIAMEMGAVSEQLPIQDIGPALLAACTAGVRA